MNLDLEFSTLAHTGTVSLPTGVDDGRANPGLPSRTSARATSNLVFLVLDICPILY